MFCRTQKNHQTQQKLRENEENLAIFTVILMATFGTKNVHSAIHILFASNSKIDVFENVEKRKKLKNLQL